MQFLVLVVFFGYGPSYHAKHPTQHSGWIIDIFLCFVQACSQNCYEILCLLLYSWSLAGLCHRSAARALGIARKFPFQNLMLSQTKNLWLHPFIPFSSKKIFLRIHDLKASLMFVRIPRKRSASLRVSWVLRHLWLHLWNSSIICWMGRKVFFKDWHSSENGKRHRGSGHLHGLLGGPWRLALRPLCRHRFHSRCAPWQPTKLEVLVENRGPEDADLSTIRKVLPNLWCWEKNKACKWQWSNAWNTTSQCAASHTHTHTHTHTYPTHTPHGRPGSLHLKQNLPQWLRMRRWKTS